MTLEHQCLLARKGCSKAGNEDFCNTRCYPYKKMHGDTGTGGIWGLADVPKIYSQVMADKLPFQAENSKAHERITKYCSNIVEHVDRGINLYLFSLSTTTNRKGTGTGKTTAACAILNEYVAARVIMHIKQERTIDDVPAMFVNVSKFQNAYNAQFRGSKDSQEQASERYYRFKERMMKVDLLVMDDIGVRDATETFMNEFYEIVDERVNEQKATIYTSNETIDTIAKRLDHRIASRIDSYTQVVEFTGDDMRKRGAGRE